MQPCIVLEAGDVDTNKYKCQRAEQQAIYKTDLHLLPYEMQFLFTSQVLIHQYTNRNRQRLCSNIPCHVQNQRLEAHHNRKHSDNRFKSSYNGRHTHAKEQQDDQPWQSFLHAFLCSFSQILLVCQTCKFCVILAHLIIDSLYDILCGDNTK